MLYGPIKGIGKNYNAVMVSFMAIERVMEILDLQPAIADKASAQKLKAEHNDICFKDVCFEYIPGVPVLKDINLEVKSGTTVALVGNSGGGKSTFVNLLPRFYDVTSGRTSVITPWNLCAIKLRWFFRIISCFPAVYAAIFCLAKKTLPKKKLPVL